MLSFLVSRLMSTVSKALDMTSDVIFFCKFEFCVDSVCDLVLGGGGGVVFLEVMLERLCRGMGETKVRKFFSRVLLPFPGIYPMLFAVDLKLMTSRSLSLRKFMDRANALITEKLLNLD